MSSDFRRMDERRADSRREIRRNEGFKEVQQPRSELKEDIIISSQSRNHTEGIRADQEVERIWK